MIASTHPGGRGRGQGRWDRRHFGSNSFHQTRQLPRRPFLWTPVPHMPPGQQGRGRSRLRQKTTPRAGASAPRPRRRRRLRATASARAKAAAKAAREAAASMQKLKGAAGAILSVSLVSSHCCNASWTSWAFTDFPDISCPCVTSSLASLLFFFGLVFFSCRVGFLAGFKQERRQQTREKTSGFFNSCFFILNNEPSFILCISMFSLF